VNRRGSLAAQSASAAERPLRCSTVSSAWTAAGGGHQGAGAGVPGPGRADARGGGGTGNDKHGHLAPDPCAREARAWGLRMTGPRPWAHRRVARPRGPVRLPSDATPRATARRHLIQDHLRRDPGDTGGDRDNIWARDVVVQHLDLRIPSRRALRGGHACSSLVPYLK